MNKQDMIENFSTATFHLNGNVKNTRKTVYEFESDIRKHAQFMKPLKTVTRNFNLDGFLRNEVVFRLDYHHKITLCGINGRAERIIVMDPDGMISVWEEYDYQNGVTTITRYTGTGYESSKRVYKKISEQVNQFTVYRDGKLTQIVEIRNNNRNKPLNEVWRNEKGEITQQVENRYNNQGELISSTETGYNNTAISGWQHVINKRGEITLTMKYDQNKNIKCTWEYDYDTQNRLINRVGFDNTGAPVKGVRNIYDMEKNVIVKKIETDFRYNNETIKEYRYDKMLNLTLKEEYANGKLIRCVIREINYHREDKDK
jgi:hypothetical protein